MNCLVYDVTFFKTEIKVTNLMEYFRNNSVWNALSWRIYYLRKLSSVRWKCRCLRMLLRRICESIININMRKSELGRKFYKILQLVKLSREENCGSGKRGVKSSRVWIYSPKAYNLPSHDSELFPLTSWVRLSDRFNSVRRSSWMFTPVRHILKTITYALTIYFTTNNTLYLSRQWKNINNL